MKTDFEIDDQGRITQELGPIHSIDIAGANTSIRRSHWRVYNDTAQELREASGYQKQSDSSYVLIEPITVSKFDRKYNRAVRRELRSSLARRLIGKGAGFVVRKFPLTAIGFFAYDWYRGGFGYAFNEVTWPLSIIWVEEDQP